jgi:hypothetical protein
MDVNPIKVDEAKLSCIDLLKRKEKKPTGVNHIHKRMLRVRAKRAF